VEALGTITVLAVDKTETLTQNRKTVAEVATPDAVFTPDGATSLPDDLHVLVEYAMLATPADPFDPMEKAIQEFDSEFLGLIGLGNPEEHAGIKTRCTA
jgi:Ca2+-transporting ATPase